MRGATTVRAGLAIAIAIASATGPALAQQAKFSAPETYGGWTVEYEPGTDSPAKCKILSDGATQMGFYSEPRGRMTIFLADDSWHFKPDVPTIVQFQADSFSTSLEMVYVADTVIARFVPQPEPAADMEVFRRTLLTLGAGGPLTVVMPSGQRIQMPSASARVADAMARCFAYAREQADKHG